MSDHANGDTQDSTPPPNLGTAGPPGHAATAEPGPSVRAEVGRPAVETSAAARDLGGRLHRLFTWAARVGVWAVAVLGVVVAVIMLGQYVFYRFTRSMTNDAFVESHIVNLSVQVEGLITRVHVEEHDLVRGGQVLAELDHVPAARELEAATAKRSVAEATLAFEQATLERLEQQFPRKVSVAEKDLAVADSELSQFKTQLRLTTDDVEKAIAEAAAAVASARAVLVKATEDYDRYKKLFEQKSVPQRRFEDATRDFRTTQAELDATQAKLAKAESDRMKIEIAELVIAQKQRVRERAEEQLRLAKLIELEIDEQRKQVAYREAQVEQAKRDEDTVRTRLQYTRVVAPFDAVVVRRFRNPGDHAPVGSPILSVYDPELVYVTAYLEEERLEGVAPGNPVHIWLDAISGSLNGRVVWIDRATGANFALVPRDVSSGEFTKVTQRVPVRIAVERDRHWSDLRPGLSATVSISHGPGDPEWAAREAEAQRRRATRGVSPLDVNLPDVSTRKGAAAGADHR
ncbi:MAG TPA: HlyD family secretion protein [Pirellulales bacterium]|jgi:membrane fusion protein (multidrug efflux system)|nr:HlyD family secretion protein [Pirellulales bacterium]